MALQPVSSAVGAILGRPDLAGPMTSTSLQDPYTAAMLQGTAGTGEGDVVGRLGAGVLLLSVLGLVAFYLWTRSYQA